MLERPTVGIGDLDEHEHDEGDHPATEGRQREALALHGRAHEQSDDDRVQQHVADEGDQV